MNHNDIQRLKRERKKQKDKFRDEQLELLKVENELLRKRVIMLREEAEHIREPIPNSV